ncbi:hypothetical protein BJ875DRAFT_286339 [Amylocarpus encephaloides]|uniref:Nudix hydrolase domain-containing protein n=1 Tax=Amylocarpus encephaloides TaxID=45428 RepID=A0A9P7YSG2_9HELO|nr:hypothetical protein BJ875DRAFT_286339 [Amylocarpus encephaloides]
MNTHAPTIGDRSYGIIAIRYNPTLTLSSPPPPPTSQTTQTLLIHQKTINHTLFPPFWTFPKGHAEPIDPSLLATAMREFEEETGLRLSRAAILTFRAAGGEADEGEGQDEAEAERKFVEVYQNPLRKVGKEVRYWPALLQDGGGGINVQEAEVVEARWCGWSEAESLLSFEEARGVLRALRSALDGKNGGGRGTL